MFDVSELPAESSRDNQTTKECFVRQLISAFTFAAVSALAVAGSISSATAASQDQYCLQGRRFGVPGNCQFSTYSQCMATASGTLDYCGINPRYAFARQRGRAYPDRR